jgi:hypothetical protein
MFWDSNQQWVLFEVMGATTNIGQLMLTAENWMDSTMAEFDTARPTSAFDIIQDGDNVLLAYTIPEPSGALLVALGASLFISSRRLRRRSLR